MSMLKSIISFLFGIGVFAFWIWGIDQNIGIIAIGLPILVICWSASQGGSGNSNDPRIGGPFDGGY